LPLGDLRLRFRFRRASPRAGGRLSSFILHPSAVAALAPASRVPSGLHFVQATPPLPRGSAFILPLFAFSFSAFRFLL
jgi:hypothetical protein